VISTHRIRRENIWNFDEKGFLLGIIQATKRIVPSAQLRKGLIKGSMQDGSREFISLLAAVSAAGMAMPPCLIYASESGDLQDSWIEDFDHENDAVYFTSSQTGWTNDQIGVSWLERFHEYTFQISGLHTRLLILDGYSSHVNIEFLKKAAAHHILVVVLPPHTTHRLQPLDVGIFSPLALAYSQALDDHMFASRGFSRITKRVFWSLFKGAWEKAVSGANVISAFEKTGIFPLRPETVLSQITFSDIEEPSEEIEDDIHQPETVREVRQLTKSIRKKDGPVSSRIDLMIASFERMALKLELVEHDNKFLNRTLVEEKKRRKRGKPAGLISSEETKYGQIWSPTKIGLRRAEIETQKQKKIFDKLQKDDERVQRQIERDNKAQEHRARVEANKAERVKKKAQKEAEIARKKREKQSLADTKAFRKARERLQSKKRVKRVQFDEAIFPSFKSPIKLQVTKTGRSTKVPTKFMD
jgi:hypothetical protein